MLPHFICKLIGRRCDEAEDSLGEGGLEKPTYAGRTGAKRTKGRRGPGRPRTQKDVEIVSSEESASAESELEDEEANDSEEISDDNLSMSSSDENSDSEVHSDYISGDEDYVIHSSRTAVVPSDMTKKLNKKKFPKKQNKKSVERRVPMLQIPTTADQGLPPGWKQDRRPDPRIDGGWRLIFWSPAGKRFESLKQARNYAGEAKQRKEKMKRNRAALKAAKAAKAARQQGQQSSKAAKQQGSKAAKQQGKAQQGKYVH